MSKIDLHEMKNKDIRTIDRDSIIDDSEIEIDESLSKEQRILDYILKSGNPYFAKYGNNIVKATYADTNITMQEIVRNLPSRR